MQKIIMFFCLLCFASNYGQNTISGKIVDENEKPLEKSHIHISSKSTVSNRNGVYSINDIPFGPTKFLISYVGYQSIDTIITVTQNQVINFKLRQKAERLNEIVIKHKDNYYNNTVSEQKIKETVIEKYSSQSLANALKEVSGVSILKSGSTIAKPVING
jgi:iron complex outermembrane receptor protein